MKREKRMKLLCIAMLCALIALGWYEGRAERQVNAEAVTEGIKRTETEGTKDTKGTETESTKDTKGTGTESTKDTRGTGTESTKDTKGTGTESTRDTKRTGTEGTKDKKGTETEGASEIRKIAITFDDDVIIGLSQEISGREAFSMI